MIFYITISYILGSIPFGLILSKIFSKSDPRKHGSKNIGATNITRLNGWKLGFSTLLLDCLKSFIPVKLCFLYEEKYILLIIIFVFIGHIFPLWLKFKGGKGIAVMIGILFGISYIYAFIFIFTWILIALIYKYSSLSAIISCTTIVIVIFLNEDKSLTLTILILNLIILIKHMPNIKRLIDKTEPKISFKK
ncbi:MAG: glycerol-3-phosphate 1-O-acyltransferase [Rickettsiales bacterium TMED254]|nr:acyl-phosphate glycerol 3-phosphate acyltransferase [Rickettsiales bacterium]RPF78153.1 MAG: glycerol-3-phosphate 1-O-acyltransferase [Rickettsiales bacterium TMED254]